MTTTFITSQQGRLIQDVQPQPAGNPFDGYDWQANQYVSIGQLARHWAGQHNYIDRRTLQAIGATVSTASSLGFTEAYAGATTAPTDSFTDWQAAAQQSESLVTSIASDFRAIGHMVMKAGAWAYNASGLARLPWRPTNYSIRKGIRFDWNRPALAWSGKFGLPIMGILIALLFVVMAWPLYNLGQSAVRSSHHSALPSSSTNTSAGSSMPSSVGITSVNPGPGSSANPTPNKPTNGFRMAAPTNTTLTPPASATPTPASGGLGGGDTTPTTPSVDIPVVPPTLPVTPVIPPVTSPDPQDPTTPNPTPDPTTTILDDGSAVMSVQALILRISLR